jgi:predicted amidophosphoribosyltransferase
MDLIFPCYCSNCHKKIGDWPSSTLMGGVFVYCQDCQEESDKAIRDWHENKGKP